jgi:type IV secretion system protein TrbC
MKNLLLTFFALFLIVGVSESALAAATAGGGLPFDSWLTKVEQSITGPFAFGVSVLGMAGAGAMLIFGGSEINAFLRSLIYVVLVLSMIIAAKNMVSTITGVGAEIPMSQEVKQPGKGGYHGSTTIPNP